MFGFALVTVLLFDPVSTTIDENKSYASVSSEANLREIVISLLDREGIDYTSLVEHVAALTREMKEQNAKMNVMISTIAKQADDIKELKDKLKNVNVENKRFRKSSTDRNGVYSSVRQNASLTNIDLDSLYVESEYDKIQNGDKHLKTNKRAISTENVAFTAYLDHEISGMNPGTTIKCNRIITNQGNGYNTFTGIFTAPVSGTYYITYTIECDHKKTNVRLMKDGVNIVDAVVHADPYSSTYKQEMATNGAVVEVAGGQSLWLETIYDHDAELFSLEGYRLVTFTGFRLY